ncbi:hypothetical protein C6P46_006602 [Rhodotorula mucilaginosa]|uniref:Uncharacterized protein n=1 Tax=Rhodotorula mucilaginosa TaxID=5537 RepID=A0A9P7B3Z9_RHOMI|nr:hypothetical protein C6P46_006602 [Rhodotorula mucilaginosa]
MAHSDTFYRKPNARELKTARQLAAAVRTHNWTAAQVDLINRPEPSQVWSMVARYLEHRVYSHGESARDTATEWFAKVEAEIEFLVELGFDPPVKHCSDDAMQTKYSPMICYPLGGPRKADINKYCDHFFGRVSMNEERERTRERWDPPATLMHLGSRPAIDQLGFRQQHIYGTRLRRRDLQAS